MTSCQVGALVVAKCIRNSLFLFNSNWCVKVLPLRQIPVSLWIRGILFLKQKSIALVFMAMYSQFYRSNQLVFSIKLTKYVNYTITWPHFKVYIGLCVFDSVLQLMHVDSIHSTWKWWNNFEMSVTYLIWC